MTRVRSFPAGLAAQPRLLLLLLLLAAAPACTERFVERYATLDEARGAGAMARGWLPARLPPSATDIHEAHDRDTNEVCGNFTAPREAVQAWASEHVDRRPVASGSPDSPIRSGGPDGQGRPGAVAPASWCRQLPDWRRFERALLGAGDGVITIGRLDGSDGRRATLIGIEANGSRVFFWTPSS